jgi:hypothetical protein
MKTSPEALLDVHPCRNLAETPSGCRRCVVVVVVASRQDKRVGTSGALSEPTRTLRPPCPGLCRRSGSGSGLLFVMDIVMNVCSSNGGYHSVNHDEHITFAIQVTLGATGDGLGQPSAKWHIDHDRSPLPLCVAWYSPLNGS